MKILKGYMNNQYCQEAFTVEDTLQKKLLRFFYSRCQKQIL